MISAINVFDGKFMTPHITNVGEINKIQSEKFSEKSKNLIEPSASTHAMQFDIMKLHNISIFHVDFITMRMIRQFDLLSDVHDTQHPSRHTTNECGMSALD